MKKPYVRNHTSGVDFERTPEELAKAYDKRARLEEERKRMRQEIRTKLDAWVAAGKPIKKVGR